jgi:hypothetical protein
MAFYMYKLYMYSCNTEKRLMLHYLDMYRVRVLNLVYIMFIHIPSTMRQLCTQLYIHSCTKFSRYRATLAR